MTSWFGQPNRGLRRTGLLWRKIDKARCYCRNFGPFSNTTKQRTHTTLLNAPGEDYQQYEEGRPLKRGALAVFRQEQQEYGILTVGSPSRLCLPKPPEYNVPPFPRERPSTGTTCKAAPPAVVGFSSRSTRPGCGASLILGQSKPEKTVTQNKATAEKRATRNSA